MTVATDRNQLRYRALADPRRRHLLRVLDDFGGPMRVETLADRLRLHANTVRGHLELLEEAGLVERSAEARDRPGRPRVLFRAVPRDARSPSAEGYRFLAEVLVGALEATSSEPDSAAEEAGKAWGRYLVDRPAPFETVDPTRAIEQVVTTLAELGFAPRVSDEDDRILIELHDCPFRDLAKTRGSVVCAVHFGLLKGMMEELRDPLTVESLDPFVAPSLCIARVSGKTDEVAGHT